MAGCELQKLSYQRDFGIEVCLSNFGEVFQDVGCPIFVGISLKAEASKTDGFYLFFRLELWLDKLQHLN